MIFDKFFDRFGDKLEFECDEHFYINGKSYNITSVVSECKADGKFQNSGELEAFCKEIPCQQVDIDQVTNTTKNVMKTKSEG